MATGYTIMDTLNERTKAGVGDTGPRAKFRTKDLSVFKIYANNDNFYPQEDIERKAGEILALGLLENLVVKYEPIENEGEYKLISGERRWQALKLLVERGYKEFEFVTCNIIAPATQQEEKVALILANSYRTKNTETMLREEQVLKATLENMKANGIELKGYDLQSGRLRDVIAQMLDISKTKVAQIESINNNLIAELVAELNDKRLTFSAAYELSGMSIERQQEALRILSDTGELTNQVIRELKGNKAIEIPDEQIMRQEEAAGVVEEPVRQQELEEESDEPGQQKQSTEPYSVSDSDTDNEVHKNKLSVKGAKHQMTDEQKYAAEQAAIDRQTKQKLQEQEYREKMNNLPGDRHENGQIIHHIKIGTSFFEDVCSGKKNFELRKNDRNYKVGDILDLMEFADGKTTGRKVMALVTYILEDYTGLTDGYCIMAMSLIEDGSRS